VSRPNPSGDADVREAVVTVRWSDAAEEWSVDLNGLSVECYPDKADADDLARMLRKALALTGNASTDRAGTERSEVSPNLQTPAPQGGGKVELTSASEVLSLMPRDPVICTMRKAGLSDSALITLGYALVADRKDRLAALKPQTPDALGEKPDRVCLATGWQAKKIDGAWRVGMTGNLDTVHDARLTVHRHEETDEVAREVAEWVARAYNATPPGGVLGGEGREQELIRVLRKTRAWMSPLTPANLHQEILKALAVRPSQSDEGERRE